jgi:hypothetical protein
MTRAYHAEKRARAKASKRILRTLGPAACVMVLALDVGDEALCFLPNGHRFVFHRVSEKLAHELEDVEVAAAIGARRLAEEGAAEAVQ